MGHWAHFPPTLEISHRLGWPLQTRRESKISKQPHFAGAHPRLAGHRAFPLLVDPSSGAGGMEHPRGHRRQEAECCGDSPCHFLGGIVAAGQRYAFFVSEAWTGAGQDAGPSTHPAPAMAGDLGSISDWLCSAHRGLRSELVPLPATP